MSSESESKSQEQLSDVSSSVKPGPDVSAKKIQGAKPDKSSSDDSRVSVLGIIRQRPWLILPVASAAVLLGAAILTSLFQPLENEDQAFGWLTPASWTNRLVVVSGNVPDILTQNDSRLASRFEPKDFLNQQVTSIGFLAASGELIVAHQSGALSVFPTDGEEWGRGSSTTALGGGPIYLADTSFLNLEEYGKNFVVPPGGSLGFAIRADAYGTVTRVLGSFRGPSTLPITKAPLRAVAYSPDGRLIATVTDGGEIFLISRADDNTLISAISADLDERVTELAFAFSLSDFALFRLLIAGPNHDARLWAIPQFDEKSGFDSTLFENSLRSFAVLSTSSGASALSLDGSLVATGSQSGEVQLWRVDGALTPYATLYGHTGSIRKLKFTVDGKYLASVAEDTTVRLWDIAGNLVDEVSVLESPIDISFSSGGDLLAVAAANSVSVFEMGTVRSLPPPWVFLAVLAAMGFLTVFAQQFLQTKAKLQEAERANNPSKTDARPPAIAAFLESDGPLQDPRLAGEALNAFTDRLSRFIRNQQTALPLVFSLVGDWGSGKSSAMGLLKHDLEKAYFPTVWFNAWHHQSEEHMFASLMEQIRAEAIPGIFTWDFYKARSLLIRWRIFVNRRKAEPLRYLFSLVIVVFLLTLTVLAFNSGERLEEMKEIKKIKGTIDFLGLAVSLGGFGTLILTFFQVQDMFKPFRERPAAMLKEAGGLFGVARFDDKLSFQYRFGRAFNSVCTALGDRRLVIMIDDLDRCLPKQVVDVFEAVNFLITHGDCVVVMGISEAPVKNALGLVFENQVVEMQLSEGNINQDAIDKHQSRRAFAEHYLEKLIAIRVSIPPFDAIALEDWLEKSTDRLAAGTAGRDGAGARWRRIINLLGVAAMIGVLAGTVYLANDLFSPVAEAVTRELGAGTGDPNDDQVGKNPGKVGEPVPDEPGIPELEIPTPIDLSDPIGVTPDQAAPTAETTDVPETTNTGPPQPLYRYGPLGLLFLVVLAGILLRRDRWIADMSARIKRLVGSDFGFVRDTTEFRRALTPCLPVVLALRETPRAVKRFGNRMRFLMSGLSDKAKGIDRIDQLVMLGMLDEVGLLEGIAEFATFDPTKTQKLISDPTQNSGGSKPKIPTLSTITPADWTHYSDLSAGVRFSQAAGQKTAKSAK